MPQRTLTVRQRQVLNELIVKAEAEQAAVAVYQSSLAAGKTRRDVALAAIRVAVIDLLGLADPGEILTIRKDYEEDGSWAGKVTFNT